MITFNDSISYQILKKNTKYNNFNKYHYIYNVLKKYNLQIYPVQFINEEKRDTLSWRFPNIYALKKNFYNMLSKYFIDYQNDFIISWIEIDYKGITIGYINKRFMPKYLYRKLVISSLV